MSESDDNLTAEEMNRLLAADRRRLQQEIQDVGFEEYCRRHPIRVDETPPYRP